MQRLCSYKFREEINIHNSSNMPPRSDIKYEIARNDPDDPNTMDYYLQHAQDHQASTKIEKSFWHSVLKTFFYISIYFILSVGLTIYNRWLYDEYKFPYPLTTSMCHLLVKFFLSYLIRSLRKCRRNNQQTRLSWITILSVLAPPGIASGLDVGFSQWALSLITLSLYTMTKSTTVIFILGFAVLFKLEKKSWSLAGVVVMISSGLLMFTYKSTQFVAFGFGLCLFASLSSGIRWTLAQLIMTKSKLGLSNPIDMIYYMQPWMVVAITPVAICFEGSKMFDKILAIDWNNPLRPLQTLSIVLSGAILAFNMEVMEFLVVTNSSSLTLSISGIVKEICTLAISYLFYHDQMSNLNFVGLLLCLGGITLHVIQKFISTKQKMIKNLELHSISITSNGSSVRDDYTNETNIPLLTANRSTSLTNLLSSNFSSDEENSRDNDNTSDVLFNILQRREQS